ncbi:MAG TPA: radical SAM protein [Syntrophorhabdaceae bacterium]|nr:radical SAM protein [Syntrophorhabdaceae bacterium]HON84478.1 radical SAM protein [Syntrophorhabdaceae bacterium]HOT41217.1 radical SAM protein [Syntrophorhabdaceae bacterium]HPC65720.1 radical SAM protein [Syntrophorhabdaceae bacterium]HQE79910.1 radical SAM protein [Syntrophorhabdaceae bacterium]
MFDDIRYKTKNGVRAIRRWVIPYLNSLIHPDQFRPVLCYLYTEWKCNIDCYYCHQYDDNREGMDLDTAKSAIDWLKTLGCRVLPLMGGEPLIRKDFILEVIRYGSENGFFVYLPTNGYLMDKEFIDEMGKAGVAAVNLAVDTIAPRKGLPKALLAIEPQFRYLVERQKKYGYLLFFNINICRTNIKDVKLLTEIAHENNIGTDYHLNEPPQGFVDVSHYKHKDDGLFITPEQFPEVDELLDWLIEKQKKGWPMVNSIEHLKTFKKRMRGAIDCWDCRAGINGALIRPDGSLSPCFDLICLHRDWGRIWEPKFDRNALIDVKEKCMPHCSSTCFHTMAYYYQIQTVPQWVRKHIRVG